MMMSKCFGFNRSVFKKCWLIMLLTFFGVVLFAFAPLVFFVVTIPQILIFFHKKMVELKELCKNRCRFYRELRVGPIMNRHLERIGIH